MGAGSAASRRPVLHFLDLEEIELNGRFAAEEGDEDRHLVAIGMDLADGADELGERPADDLDVLADGIADFGLRLGLLPLGRWPLQDIAPLPLLPPPRLGVRPAL